MLGKTREIEILSLILISGGGLIALFGAHLIHYDGAGGLATIIMAFVAGKFFTQNCLKICQN